MKHQHNSKWLTTAKDRASLKYRLLHSLLLSEVNKPYLTKRVLHQIDSAAYRQNGVVE